MTAMPMDSLREKCRTTAVKLLGRRVTRTQTMSFIKRIEEGSMKGGWKASYRIKDMCAIGRRLKW
jgi:hypothetical protein